MEIYLDTVEFVQQTSCETRGHLTRGEDNVMQPSIFNKLVPLAGRDDSFLMNTFTDAQLVISRDVVELLDRVGTAPDLAATLDDTERSALRDLAGC